MLNAKENLKLGYSGHSIMPANITWSMLIVEGFPLEIECGKGGVGGHCVTIRENTSTYLQPGRAIRG